MLLLPEDDVRSVVNTELLLFLLWLECKTCKCSSCSSGCLGQSQRPVLSRPREDRATGERAGWTTGVGTHTYTNTQTPENA